jgi:hypothetical protein
MEIPDSYDQCEPGFKAFYTPMTLTYIDQTLMILMTSVKQALGLF